MTLEELKQKIDGYIGLVSEVKPRRTTSDNVELVYKSPTGVLLFTISVGDYGEGWEFGGYSGALPESWQVLCRIHRQ